MKYTCENCLYANFRDDGTVMCDKKILLDGKEYIVDADKVDKKCLGHSSYPVEDWRYDRPWTYLSEADDVCQVCARMLNMLDRDSYDYVDEIYLDKNDKEKSKTVRKCKICIEKGR